MAAASKGGAFLLLLLLAVAFVSADSAAASAGDDHATALDRQEAHLQRLEALALSLSTSVSVLESSLAACSAARSEPLVPHRVILPPPDLETFTASVPTIPQSVIAAESGTVAVGAGAEGGAGVAVTKHRTSWSERFQFAAAAQLEEASPASVVMLPYEDLDGLSKYFAVGDTRGRVFVFSSAGDVLLELPSLTESPVTSMLSYLSSRRNESLLFTGHADGSVIAHHLWETAENGDDWLTISVGSSKSFALGSREVDSPAVSGLEVHQVGRLRYVLASDVAGRIRVYTENGTLYGTAIASSEPLVFMKQRLLFLTETGAGSLDLRSMTVRETECEGLNGSLAKAYSFSLSERSKAYGFTAGGDLIHVLLLGDVTNLKCRVRFMRKSEFDKPVAIQTVKGYLLVATYDKVAVYNISSQYYGRVVAPRALFSATIHEIKSLFLSSNAEVGETLDAKPLIAADRGKLVVLGLGGGYIGIYRSNFPAFKVESNAVVWSGPVLLFLLFLIGVWQFYVKKKDSLGWASEEAFNVSGPDPGSFSSGGNAERPYVDGVRTADLRDMRGGALRGPTRRHVSPPPPHYSGGTGVSFRPASADPSLRGSAELKFKGQNIEPVGFAKRRELLFGNSQVASDHVD